MPALVTTWLAGPRLHLEYASASSARETMFADIAAACASQGATPTKSPEQVGRGGVWVVEVECAGNVAPTPAGPRSLVGFAPVFDVTEYGALGDGVADDREAIQEALDAAGELPAGGTVFVPSGTYLLGYGVSVPANVRLLGEGVTRTVLKLANNALASDAVCAAYLTSVVALHSVTGASVAHLEIDGNRANNINPRTVAQVNLAAWRGGVYVGGTAFTAERSVDCTIEDLYIHDVAGEGFVIKYATDCVARRIYSEDNSETESPTVNFDGNAGIIHDAATNCHILDCEGWRCVHGGFEIYGPQSVDCSIQNCHTDSIIRNSARIYAGAGRHVIRGNRVDTRWRDALGPGAAKGIVCTPDNAITIENNIIRCGDGSGMELFYRHGDSGTDRATNSKRCRITNNTVFRDPADCNNNTAVGLQLDDADDCVVTGNTFSGSWHYTAYVRVCRNLVMAGNTFVSRTTAQPDYYAPDDDSREGVAPSLRTYGVVWQQTEDSLFSGNSVRGALEGFSEIGFGNGTPTSRRNRVRGNQLRHNYRSFREAANARGVGSDYGPGGTDNQTRPA